MPSETTKGGRKPSPPPVTYLDSPPSMEQMVPPDNTPRNINKLARDYHQLNDQIETTRQLSRQLAHQKAELLAELRKELTVAEIAQLLDVTPALIYNTLRDLETSS